MDSEHVVFTTGVIPAISSLVRSLTNVAEKVVLQPPVYNIFTNSLVNNVRRVLNNPLRYEHGVCSMDFEDLGRKLADPLTRLMILRNPQNRAPGRHPYAIRRGQRAEPFNLRDLLVAIEGLQCGRTAVRIFHLRR